MTLQQVEDAICVEQILARAKLRPNEIVVINRRFYEGLTLREIAFDRGLSVERIRQIELNAMRKIRRAAGVRPKDDISTPSRPRWKRWPVPEPVALDSFDEQDWARIDYVRENWDRLCNERAMELAHLPHKIGAIYGTADSSRA